jgi:hypothetical protein
MLTIDLQEGFEGDQVVIAVDDREVFRKSGVKTRHQIGLAERVRLDVAPGPRRLRVSLPDRDLQRELQIEVGGDPMFAVSLVDNRVDIGPLTAPRYL